jgi:hypothetical protein
MARQSHRKTLQHLEMLRERFDHDAAVEKAHLLKSLEKAQLAGPSEILHYHDALTFSRAYPDTHEVHRLAERGCSGFHRRRDVKRHGAQLLNSGLAGTTIAFRFYWPTALWLAERWPDRLSLDWEEIHDDGPLIRMLHLLMPYTESAAIYEEDHSAREWIERLKGKSEKDAVFLIKRFAALPMDGRAKEKIWDDLDLPLVLLPAADTPNRTTPWVRGFPEILQQAPRSRHRPDLKSEMLRPPKRIRRVNKDRGAALLDLARITMISRDRDLDAIAFGNPEDITVIEDDVDGVQFVGVGTLPERRYLLEGTYVYLVLRNGVPVGYMQGSGLCGWCEINFNIFPPWRGAEAGLLYGRSIALLHAMMGMETFVVEPYQLGDGNEEALKSGAWWFYAKMGYRPFNTHARRLAEREFKRSQKGKGYRTPLAVLAELAEHGMVLHLGKKGRGPFRYGMVGKVGLKVSAFLAHNWGADREAGIAQCVQEASRFLLGKGGRLGRQTQAQKLAWKRWSPLIMAMVAKNHLNMSPAEKRALAEVIQLKGGPREEHFLKAVGSHLPLQQALATFSRGKR